MEQEQDYKWNQDQDQDQNLDQHFDQDQGQNLDLDHGGTEDEDERIQMKVTTLSVFVQECISSVCHTIFLWRCKLTK